MISGTFPAATASGLMRQTVISFFPSESSEKKKYKLLLLLLFYSRYKNWKEEKC